MLANEFYDRFAKTLDEQHRNDLKQLRMITSRDQLTRSELRKTLCAHDYNVKVCEDSMRLIKDFLKLKNSKILIDVFRERVKFEGELNFCCKGVDFPTNA